MPPEDPKTAQWFANELQPHEAFLRAWLASQFSPQCDIDDIVQESFVRALHAHTSGEVRSPKAFLFVTARNLALMKLRHLKVERTDSLAEINVSGILDEDVDIPNELARAEELELLTKAIQSLPDRCRQVVTLRRIYGMSQKEVAAKLGIAVHTVEIQSAIGLRKIGHYFAQHHRSMPR